MLEATVSATGYRTQKVSIPSAIINNPAVPVTLAEKPTVSGSIPGAPVGTDVITATAPSMADVKGSVTAPGVYSIVLDSGPGASSRTWTLSYDQIGVGEGSATVVVAPTGTPVAPTINLTVRDVTYDFTVTTPGSPDPLPVNGATVAILNDLGDVIESETTGPPSAAGTRTVTVKENTKPTRWRVSHPDFLTKSGPVSALTPALTEDIGAVLQPKITGTVTDAAAAPPAVVGATVVVCPPNPPMPPTPTTACTPVETDRTTTSIAGGVYSLNSDLPAGSYSIWATAGAKSASITLVIDAQGRATLTPTNGEISLP